MQKSQNPLFPFPISTWGSVKTMSLFGWNCHLQGNRHTDERSFLYKTYSDDRKCLMSLWVAEGLKKKKILLTKYERQLSEFKWNFTALESTHKQRVVISHGFKFQAIWTFEYLAISEVNENTIIHMAQTFSTKYLKSLLWNREKSKSQMSVCHSN